MEDGKSWRNLTTAQAAIITALIGVIPAIITAFLTLNEPNLPVSLDISSGNAKTQRISQKIPSRIGYKNHIYPNLGIGLQTPSQWIAEDAAAIFSGGEIDFIKRYEDTKAAVGIKIRYRSIQDNYIHDINAEVENQKHVWEKIDPNVKVNDTTINGIPAKVWKYNQSTGKRVGDLRWYWVRIVPEIKLEIVGFIYTDSIDNKEFWTEVDDIIKSLVIDEIHINERKNLLNNRT